MSKYTSYTRVHWPEYQVLVDAHKAEWFQEIIPTTNDDLLVPTEWIQAYLGEPNEKLIVEFDNVQRIGHNILVRIQKLIPPVWQGEAMKIMKIYIQELHQQLIDERDAALGLIGKDSNEV